jgi:glycosyltransferase involved in cell wall biosynthesis
MQSSKPRLLVFVIAYYAEETLTKVLERIPSSVFSDYATDVLVVDDASADRTFAIGREYGKAHPEVPLTVLHNQLNQGYGGNQKVGYHYAIANGYDFVAMVHGDGQYAPEELPRLLEPLRTGKADAVFGSRMMTATGALRGGMPLYKYVGNRILTTAQNALLRSKLSEFHSGYRVYATKALARIQFRLNSNDFHFDTEIIIQLMNAGQRIIELPIPTYYGDEISRVNGMKYAKDVMLATLRNVAHRAGLLYQRRFDPVPDGNAHYDLKLGYASSHQWALDAVPDGARVMDIGAGPGGVAGALVRKGCEVAVVDQHQPRIADAKVKVVVQDLDQPPSFDVSKYQYLLLLDVIEHLKDPEAFVDGLRKQFTYESKTLVLTTPNIAFVVQRLMLLAGQFNYGKAGILDRTHTRLFTFRAMERLLRDAGFKVKELKGVPAPFPKVFGDNVVGRSLVKANELAIGVSRTLFAYQIFVVAESTPDVDFVLNDTLAHTQKRESEESGLSRIRSKAR